MCARTRLNPDERRKEILNAGMKLFKEKGFIHTTMEDIVNATTLSKGGLYHYYQSTESILRDLMEEGIKYRVKALQSISTCSTNRNKIDLIAESMFEKIIDQNPYMDIYVQFLISKNKRPQLEQLFQQLKAETAKEFEQLQNFKDLIPDPYMYDFITDVINGLLISAQLLHGRENFKSNRDILIDMFKVIIKKALAVSERKESLNEYL